jgi:SAM-dependent methyltransferase
MPKRIYHLTIEHLYYLLNNECNLTFKADGIFKIRNEYNGVCEYEKLNDGRELIFDYITKENENKNVNDRIKEYCNLINFEMPLFNELNLENFECEINKYIDFYSKIKLDKIPKLYLKVKQLDSLAIINKLNEYFPEINFPTDGWVIVPNDTKYSAKIKPLSQMTIDLKYKNRNFYDSNYNIYSIESKNLKNNSIYRCYFSDNKWIAREERADKRYPNSKYVVDLIQNQINFKLNLNSVNIQSSYTPYYVHKKRCNSKFYNFFSHINLHTQKYLQACRNTEVLDVGCGKNSSIQMWKEINPKKLIGLDIDPICIFKSSAITNSNNYIWFNFNTDWNIIGQIKYFGKQWEHSQVFKFNNLYSKFDYIVFNFSIHYSDNYLALINNMKQFIKKGSKLKFNWIDYDKLTCFNIKITNNLVRLNLPWKEEMHEEPYFDYNLFSDLLSKNGWSLVNQNKINEFHSEYIEWQNNIFYDTWIFN